LIKSKDLKNFPLIESGKLKSALVLCHRNADVDAYCSAYGVVSLLEQINPKVDIAIASPNGLSAIAKKVQDRFSKKVTEMPNIPKADLIVIVDTGDLSLLGGWSDELRFTKAPKVFIDHHPLMKSTESVADLILVDDRAFSCSEIVHRIFKAKRTNMTKDVAQALLIGIMFDSQHLAIADCKTVKVVAELCKKGASPSEAKKVLEMPRSLPKVIAHVKAAKRLRAYRAEDLVIAITNVKSFQATVANSLLGLGVDLAFALGSHEDGVRGSLRATQSFYSKTGVHLGIDIAEKVASTLKGKGGGHSTAASLFSSFGEDKIIDQFLSTLSEKLQTKIKEIK
jgi:nanoRNase/pAp phosphatase (c-di-AMP/oligoRNAs hydrolase)